MSKHTPKHRVCTVEYEPGWGWIARDPRTGAEVLKDFRWRTRAAARDVVACARAAIATATQEASHAAR